MNYQTIDYHSKRFSTGISDGYITLWYLAKTLIYLFLIDPVLKRWMARLLSNLIRAYALACYLLAVEDNPLNRFGAHFAEYIRSDFVRIAAGYSFALMAHRVTYHVLDYLLDLFFFFTRDLFETSKERTEMVLMKYRQYYRLPESCDFFELNHLIFPYWWFYQQLYLSNYSVFSWAFLSLCQLRELLFYYVRVLFEPSRIAHPEKMGMIQRGNSTSVGHDVIALEDIVIPSKGYKYTSMHVKISTHVYEIGHVALRSSWVKKGLFTSSSVIDPGYEGDWGMVIFNSNDSDMVIPKGERYCQVYFLRYNTNIITENTYLPLFYSGRRDGGWGSTGK